MKFNFKSKLGFTLIELLVVIGILAVLAAIAIPSVAGLIDRANVSADATNANEMTNAIERFTSEYELYLQDIASERLDTTNLDSAQGRVYNVTGVTDRAGIEALEKDASAGIDTTGKAIYRDTKYPVNAETMQAVVENYMKTSSTTFTPKQSDCHYYYSPDCGLVVCTETEKSDVTDLNALVQSGKDAKGKDLGTTTKWIDLTNSISLSGDSNTPAANDGKIEYGVNDPDLNHNGIIPEGAYYGNFDTIAMEIIWYTKMPASPSDYDVYLYGDYFYGYTTESDWFVTLATESFASGLYPAGFEVTTENQTSYDAILESINGQPISSVQNTFNGCKNLTTAPEIPSGVTDMAHTFMYCTSLKTAPRIPDGVTDMNHTFRGCTSLTTVPEIPSSVTDMNQTFDDCTSLTGTIKIPCQIYLRWSWSYCPATVEQYHYTGCGH